MFSQKTDVLRLSLKRAHSSAKFLLIFTFLFTQDKFQYLRNECMEFMPLLQLLKIKKTLIGVLKNFK